MVTLPRHEHIDVYLQGVIFTFLWRIENNVFRSALFWLLGKSISVSGGKVKRKKNCLFKAELKILKTFRSSARINCSVRPVFTFIRLR